MKTMNAAQMATTNRTLSACGYAAHLDGAVWFFSSTLFVWIKVSK